jgi:hypothetical protein
MAGETLAWRTIKPGQKVLDQDGSEIGSVSRVLADDSADIFHGISVRRRLMGPELEVVADRIGRISEDTIHTSLGAAELESPGNPGSR